MGRLPHEPALDGLRALAVGLVIANHLFPKTLATGWVGVNLFFVLSGYLITRLLMQEMQETGTIKLGRFYLRRAMRLMPPLWTLLLLLLPLMLSGHHANAQLQSWSMAATYLMNFNRAFGWMSDYALGHTWSLAAEEQFYWLWPAVLLLGARKWPRLTVGTLFLTMTAWRLYLFHHGASLSRVYNGPDTDSDAILAGCFLALTPIPEKVRTTIATLWPLWLGLVIYGAVAVEGTLNAEFIAALTLSCFVGAAFIIATEKSALGKILSTKPMVFTGKISYALYLWHYPLIVLMNARWHLPGAWKFAPVIFAYALSAISYFTVEAYFRMLKRGRWMQGEPAIVATSAA